jgi:hypothetical protein
MAMGRSTGVDRGSTVLVATVAGLIGLSGILGASGWGLRALQTLVRNGQLGDALFLSWVALVLVRHPYPGLAPVTGRLSRSRHRRRLVTTLGVLTLVLVVVLLGGGLGLVTGLGGVPGLHYLLIGVVALGGVGVVARRRPVSGVSRIELVLAVPFTFGFLARELASEGPGITTLDQAIAGTGAVAAAMGVAIAAGLRIRPPAPFNDPLKLVLGGVATVMGGILPDAGLTMLVVLALIVMPTIVAVVELALLIEGGTVGGRSRALPVLEVLEEPTDPIERDLRRIKGTFRRTRSRELVESGELPVPDMRTHELAEHLKLALQMQVGSRARGGEDLPDLLSGEVELARITYTQTVHGEVVSLRAVRAGDDRLALRLVDEYGTEFTLPFDEVSGTISAEQVVELFRTSAPAPTDVGAFSVLSDVIPDLNAAFGRSFVVGDTVTAPRGIGAAIRGHLAMGIMGAVTVARMSLDVRGFAVSYEARFYAFGALVVRSLVNSLAPDLATLLWALMIPVPALVVRRVRTIGLETLKADAPRLILGAGAIGMLGAVAFDLPIAVSALTIAPSIVMLYLMFRQGPTERAILSSEWSRR